MIGLGKINRARPDPRRAAVFDQLVSRLPLDGPVVARAQSLSLRTGQTLEQVLNNMGVVSDNDLAQAYAEVCDAKVWDPLTDPAQAADSTLVTAEFLKARRLLVLAVTSERLTVAAYDPLDDEGLAGLAFAVRRDIEIHVAKPADYRRAAHELYGVAEVASAPTESRLDAEAHRVVEVDHDSEAARALTGYLEAALAQRASDIHLEPRRHDFRVRLRIDGRLIEFAVGSTALAASVISRLKVLANLNLGERRLPQDGRATFVVEGATVDTRISVTPSAFGEAAVLRILDRVGIQFDFASLGIAERHLKRLAEVARASQGMFLVSGPTGSGKTTTLYALLNRLADSEKKILSVEDPVEHHFAHVCQVQVQPAIGLTFETALRSFLRQDPDVILVGEIRDPETAAIAVQAAMTGHLVLASIHANDAVRVTARLLDLGLAPYQIASVLRGAASQRLVRRLCPSCRVERTLSEAERVFLAEMETQTAVSTWSPVGCAACSRTGFRGRVAIMETLAVDEKFAHAIARGAATNELEDAARANGFVSLRHDALSKAEAGVTSLQEIMAVLGA